MTAGPGESLGQVEVRRLRPGDLPALAAAVGRARAAGFCSTTPDRADGVIGPHAEIWTVGVRPDHQGRGPGRRLLRWGVERLRSIGAEEISLSVNRRNERALGSYEREGFRRVSTRERWARPVGPDDAPSPARSGRAG